MKLIKRRSRQHQRGVAAIELALLLPMLIIILWPLILCAQYLWHYTVVHKAAQDAAHFMSTVPRTDMNSRVLAGRAKDVAEAIVIKELSDLAHEEDIAAPEVECDANDCGTVAKAPETVRVMVSFDFYDRIFNIYLGPRGLAIEANVTMQYVGK